MKRISIIILLIACIFKVSAQTYTLEYGWSNPWDTPPCNPFVTDQFDISSEVSNIGFTKWQASHGSPNLIESTNSGNYSILRLRTDNSAGSAEGIFIRFDFESDHKYSINALVKGQDAGLRIDLANGLSASSSQSCTQGSKPSASQQAVTSDDYYNDWGGIHFTLCQQLAAEFRL